MRDVLVSLFILLSLPSCFRRPFIGLASCAVRCNMNNYRCQRRE